MSEAPARKVPPETSGNVASFARRPAAVLGALLLLGGTLFAFLQPPRREALQTSSWTTLDWWRFPVERNAVHRLTVFPGELRGVFALRGTRHVWYVGSGGLVIHSSNAGRTWADTNLTARVQREQPAAKAASIDRGRREVSRTLGTRDDAYRSGATGAVAVLPVSYRPEGQEANPRQSPNQRALATVPSVIGRRFYEIEKDLMGSGLRLGRVDTVRTSSRPAGTVVRQSPTAGTQVDRGTPVSVSVAFPEPAAPPESSRTGRTRVDSGPAAGTTPPAPLSDTTFYPRLNAICFADAQYGWVAGEGGALFATSDGGVTWRQLDTHTTVEVRSATCTRRDGLFATSDGRTTVRVSASDSAFAELGSIESVASPEITRLPGGTLWAIGGALTRAGGRTRLISDDFGRTWRRPDSASTQLRGSVSFASNSVGFAAGDSAVLVTTDGGGTWRTSGCRFSSAAGTSSAPPFRVHAWSTTNALAVGVDGRVWTTGDSWQTCASRSAIDVSGITSIAALSSDLWFLATTEASASADGGQSWQPLVSPRRFSHLEFFDHQRGWASLESGNIGQTIDGGRTWRVVTVDSGNVSTVDHIVARTPREIFAARSDALYHSRDGGTLWSRVGDTDSTLLPVFFADSLNGWAAIDDSIHAISAAADGRIARAATGLPRIIASFFSDSVLDMRDASVRSRPGGVLNGWIVTDDGALLAFRDSSWTPVGNATPLLSAVSLDDTTGFGLDSVGRLMRSRDAGRTWTAVDSTPRKYPAPWFYPFVLVCVGATVAAVRVTDKRPQPAEKSIADILISDRPLRKGDRDVLDFAKIAGGLSRFLRNTRTEPPLTIAITGPWGTGKSSLMNMLRADLDRRRFRTVWFNAWHHQREESLLASLLESIRLTATPKIWTVTGLRFRARLLWRRFSRYSVPVLVTLPILAVAVGYILQAPRQRLHELSDAYKAIVDFLKGDPAPKAHEAEAPAQRALFAVIVSIIGTIITYAKGLKAFGVNPALLAKNVAGAGSIKTSEVQPAFRYRFAQDFREVTDALKPERLVIFIDDLDRCKPEQVLELLEAVNFLVDSGDCVVVLGIDRERVTGCVAIGFKEVASVLTDMDRAAAPRRDPPEDAASARTKRSTADAEGLDTPVLQLVRDDVGKKPELQRQVEYARHYLEKLLNMEIPIPPATAEGLGNVMTDSGTARDEAKKKEPVPWDERLRALRLPLQAASTIALVGLALFFGLRGPAAFRPGQQTLVTPAATARGSEPGDAATGIPVPPPGDTAKVVTPQRSRVPIRMVAGSIPSTAWWPNAVLFAAALGVLVWLLTPRETNRVNDSEAFAKALKAWAPVLYEEFRTPRAAKKFLNHVRFLSMAQRAPGPTLRPVDRVIEKVRALWPVRYVVDAFRGTGDQERLAPGSIPEVVLVSLSVIAQRYPDWLREEEFWETDLRSYVEEKLTTIPADIQQALTELDKLQSPTNIGPFVETHRAHGEAWTKLVAWVQPE